MMNTNDAVFRVRLLEVVPFEWWDSQKAKWAGLNRSNRRRLRHIARRGRLGVFDVPEWFWPFVAAQFQQQIEEQNTCSA